MKVETQFILHGEEGLSFHHVVEVPETLAVGDYVSVDNYIGVIAQREFILCASGPVLRYHLRNAESHEDKLPRKATKPHSAHTRGY